VGSDEVGAFVVDVDPAQVPGLGLLVLPGLGLLVLLVLLVLPGLGLLVLSFFLIVKFLEIGLSLSE